MPEDTIPVIIGVGEVADRPGDEAGAREPLALMAAAARNAADDAGAPALLGDIDSIDVVNLVSWRYEDAARALADAVGAAPRRAVYGPVGGESPVRYLHEAALRIARGESQVALIAGAEAQYSAVKAAQAQRALPWTPIPADLQPVQRPSIAHPMAVALGVNRPITVYPFYDVATAAAWGQTPRQALAESGTLWETYASVARANPYAWLRRDYSAKDITTPSAKNRLIAWPYTKLMVANNQVNQGAALLLTSLTIARAAGIPDTRMIHVWGGAAANEPRDYLARDHYNGSHAQDVVLETAMAISDGKAFDALELYSCFPCVPKMARRTLGLGPDVVPTVTGGLTFFGAPLNSYMTHAACAMVRHLRSNAGTGLVYGQGEYVTKHHALVLSSTPPSRSLESWTPSVQDAADGRRGAVPPLKLDHRGGASLESFTIIYNRDGSVGHGVVILRTGDGGRTLARVDASDERTLARLVDPDHSPVGVGGDVTAADDSRLQWRLSSA